MRVTNARPYSLSAGRAPSTTFQVIRPTSAVAPAAAAPATTCNTRSPKRTRRPEKGRRAASGVSSAEDNRDRQLLIFEIVFSATTSTVFGIGWKSSLGPKVWPLVTAQKRNFRSSAALLDFVGTITYV